MRLALAGLAAACALAACQTDARAQDTWNHGGAYVGIAAGYNASALTTPGTDFAATGALGGLLAGYGMVGKSGVYVGLEGDWTIKDIKWTTAADGYGASASNHWMGSARLRVGQTWGPAMAYLTGGVATTDQKVEVAGLGSTTDWKLGWVGGAGIEAQMTKTMALRLEVLHYEFSDKSVTIGGERSDKIGSTDTVGRVGITFKLN